LSYILRVKPIKDNLIGYFIFYKNGEENNVTSEICLQLLQIPKQIYKHSL